MGANKSSEDNTISTEVQTISTLELKKQLESVKNTNAGKLMSFLKEIPISSNYLYKHEHGTANVLYKQFDQQFISHNNIFTHINVVGLNQTCAVGLTNAQVERLKELCKNND